MILRFFFVAVFLFVSHSVHAIDLDKAKIIDLSHAYDSQTIYWPTAKGFQFKKVYQGITEKGFYYTANEFQTAEHGGTHIDAPIHFYKGRHTVDKIPLKQLIGDGIVVDVSKKALKNKDYQVVVQDFRAWEEKYGNIPDGSIVILKTGYSQYWPNRVKYMGTNERGPKAVAQLHFPGLHPDAAKWLTENRKIKAIGLDTPSIDYGQSKMFGSHVMLFKHNIPAFENLANLERLPAKGFSVVALPMKIKGGSGGPLRIVALVE